MRDQNESLGRLPNDSFSDAHGVIWNRQANNSVRKSNRKILRFLFGTLELMRPDGAFNAAGELLADENTFPGIDAARFGDSISIFLDRKTFEHESLLAQFDDALEMYRTYYQFEEVTGSTRVLREIVPESAFKEAIANALVHRQWDIPAQIRMSMFADKIEIASPGGLPHGLSKEEYLEGQVSVLRNPIIGGIFFRLRLIERFGTGDCKPLLFSPRNKRPDQGMITR